MTLVTEPPTDPGPVQSTPVVAAAPPSAPPTGFSYLSMEPPARPPGRVIGALILLTAALALLGAEAGFLWASAQDDRWEGRSEIEYRGDSWTETQDLAIRSRTLTEPIAARWQIDIKTFEERLQAGLIPGTQVLRIGYLDEDPDVARGVVADVTSTYLAITADGEADQAITAVSDQLNTLEVELEASVAELETRSEGIAPGEPLTIEVLDLQAEINSLRSRIGLLELRLIDEELQAIETDASGVPRIITDPFVLEEPAFPKPVRTAAIGMLIGLVAAAVMWVVVWNMRQWRTTV